MYQQMEHPSLCNPGFQTNKHFFKDGNNPILKSCIKIYTKCPVSAKHNTNPLLYKSQFPIVPVVLFLSYLPSAVTVSLLYAWCLALTGDSVHVNLLNNHVSSTLQNHRHASLIKCSFSGVLCSVHTPSPPFSCRLLTNICITMSAEYQV